MLCVKGRGQRQLYQCLNQSGARIDQQIGIASHCPDSGIRRLDRCKLVLILGSYGIHVSFHGVIDWSTLSLALGSVAWVSAPTLHR